MDKALFKKPKFEKAVKSELNLLKKCDNEHVIKYINAFHNPKYLFIVLEYCNGGNLE